MNVHRAAREKLYHVSENSPDITIFCHDQASYKAFLLYVTYLKMGGN